MMQSLKHLSWGGLVAGSPLLGLSGGAMSTTNHGWSGSYAPAGFRTRRIASSSALANPINTHNDGEVYTS